MASPRFEIKPLVRSMSDEDGAVLLDLEGGRYFSLNGVGADVWRQIERGARCDEIVAFLNETYEASPETVKRDLEMFLEALASKRLIRRS